VFVESNFAAILQQLAAPVFDGASIRLGTVVSAVEAPETRRSDGKVTVVTADGSRLPFDEVVMTVPLGWLQRNVGCFSPELPPRLRQAINGLSFSHTEKVYIRFSRAWWRQPLDKDPASYFNWLDPDYAPEANPQRWRQGMWDLSTSRPPHNHPIMLFYTYGDCARHVITSTNGRSKQEKLAFIAGFFRPYFSKLPGYDAADESCHPVDVLVTEWMMDEMAGFASYCNFQVGTEQADQDVLTIREGCPDRRLWFCGEHAAPFEECGTATGAYLSGESVAERILAIS